VPSTVEEAPLVLYRLGADVVMIVHFAFIAFVAVGGVLAWRWPRVVLLHVPVVLWSAAIVTVGFTCPLTPLEQYFRRRAGESAYDGGFIDHYLEGVIYPGRFTALAQLLVAAAISVGYGGLVVRHRRRQRVVS
jgi:Protein of Unknown function (DUF2784)